MSLLLLRPVLGSDDFHQEDCSWVRRTLAAKKLKIHVLDSFRGNSMSEGSVSYWNTGAISSVPIWKEKRSSGSISNPTKSFPGPPYFGTPANQKQLLLSPLIGKSNFSGRYSRLWLL